MTATPCLAGDELWVKIFEQGVEKAEGNGFASVAEGEVGGEKLTKPFRRVDL